VAIFTNASPQGGRLHYDVSTWALGKYLGLSTPLLATTDLPAAQLAEYVGRFGIDVDIPEGGGAAGFLPRRCSLLTHLAARRCDSRTEGG
jgi:hypothetical protein